MYKYLVLVLTLLFTGCSTYNKMNVVSPNVLLDNSQYEIVGDIEGQATYTQYLFGRISFDQDYYKNELLLTEAGVKLDDSGNTPNLTTDAKRYIYQRAEYYKSEDIVYPEPVNNVKKRFFDFLKHLIETYHKTDENILIASHAGVIEQFIRKMQNHK